jgi:hypothetical protein
VIGTQASMISAQERVISVQLAVVSVQLAAIDTPRSASKRSRHRATARASGALLLSGTMRRAMLEVLVFCALAGLVGSCGGGDAAVAPLDLSTCQDNWSVLLQDSRDVWAITTDLNGSGLTWSNGLLYFEHRDWTWANPGTIASISASTPVQSYTDMAPVDSSNWWIEGDQLLYVSSTYQLYSVPLAGGGQPTLLVDIAQDSANSFLTKFVLDAEAVYWVSLQQTMSATAPGLGTTTGWSVWRGLRATGERQRLAIMPVSYPQSGLGASLALTQDSVLAYDGIPGSAGTLFLVPKTGGGPVTLPSPSSAWNWMLGTSPDGVALWLTLVPGESGCYEMWRSTSDGTPPTPFWTDKPPELYLTNAWSDGSGGWYMAAWEFTNMAIGSRHTSIWSLDKSGRSARLACNPFAVGTDEDAMALSPTALFLLDSDDSPSQTRSIVSIARQQP